MHKKICRDFTKFPITSPTISTIEPFHVFFINLKRTIESNPLFTTMVSRLTLAYDKFLKMSRHEENKISDAFERSLRVILINYW